MSSLISVDIPQSSMVGQQRQQISELQVDKFPAPQSFVWKIRFKNQVTTCSDFPSEAMVWIKEVEMVDSLKELKSSRSVSGKKIPNFEMLDAKTASAQNKVINNSHFKKKVCLEEQKAQKDGRFPRGRQIALMIDDYFRVTGAHDTVLGHADVFSVTLRDDNEQEFDTRWDDFLLSMSKILTISLRNDAIQDFDSKWDGILLSMTKIPPDDILEGLYKLRIRESEEAQDRIGIVRHGD